MQAREILRSATDRLALPNIDPRPVFFKRSTPPDDLSQQQRRFGEEHRATPGMRAGTRQQLVYFYRHEHASTHRWLVDADGEIVDFVALH